MVVVFKKLLVVLLRIAFGTYNDYKGIYIFDEALAADPNQDLIQLYHNYKKIANKKLQYVQHQTQECSN